MFGFKAVTCTQLALICTFAHIADLPPQDVIKEFHKMRFPLFALHSPDIKLL